MKFKKGDKVDLIYDNANDLIKIYGAIKWDCRSYGWNEDAEEYSFAEDLIKLKKRRKFLVVKDNLGISLSGLTDKLALEDIGYSYPSALFKKYKKNSKLELE